MLLLTKQATSMKCQKTITRNLHDNITGFNKKAPPRLGTSVNLEANSISIKHKISNRVECIASTPAFSTIKDQKDKFCFDPTCCLINASKKELGKMSKQLVKKKNLILLACFSLTEVAVMALF